MNQPISAPTYDALCAWLVEQVAQRTNQPAERIDVREAFAAFGLDSMQAVTMIGELEAWIGRPLTATLVWDFPSIEALARHVSSGGG